MYRMLVVDDEKIIRNGIKNMLTWENIPNLEIETAASAREALEIIARSMPDIMITDISMTEMSGIELIGQIREQYQNIQMRIIVLTGYDKFEYAQQCLRLSVVDFLLKPIDEELLKNLVREQVQYLDKQNLEKQSQKRQQRTKGVEEQMKLERVMCGLIHEEEDILPEAERMLQSYSYPYMQPMQLAILLPVQYRREKEEDDFFLTTISHICMGMVDERNRGITFRDNEKIMMVFFVKEQEDNILEQIEELIDILKDEYGSKPKVIVGSVVSHYRELPISYHDAVYLLENERQNIRDIIKPNLLENKVNVFQEIYTELKNIMISNTGNPEQVLKAFRTFQKAVESYNLSNAYVRRCCFEIASSLYFSYVSDTGEAADNKLNALLQTLTRSEREEACEITGDFITRLYSKEELSVHEIVSKAQGYIEQNLEADISVANIAESLYITPNYFSRLFKRVTGEGCNEYIVRKRIEQAKFLLETTNLKTGKIAAMVGYRDTNYFSLAFKKHTGESPTKYRENVRG